MLKSSLLCRAEPGNLQKGACWRHNVRLRPAWVPEEGACAERDSQRERRREGEAKRRRIDQGCEHSSRQGARRSP